ncbi:hypothetical protein CTU88_46350 [Streptomyces sp. JV178]|uniref:hypothetical protein n=1 Tax=Streptomyces sp. JV178 TaxID=858632 RepID=UPI000C64831B|nr:hypothetical protein [Streptomyces sp. JV178]PIM65909.1 hypothetical protein CTU88_46350 [Streptomyces sp. JV178]
MAAATWRDAGVDGVEGGRRHGDVRAYLDPAATRAERRKIARRYGVRWLLLTRWREAPEEAVVVDFSPRTGEVLARIAP